MKRLFAKLVVFFILGMVATTLITWSLAMYNPVKIIYSFTGAFRPTPEPVGADPNIHTF